jgi:hypothetical protein
MSEENFLNVSLKEEPVTFEDARKAMMKKIISKGGSEAFSVGIRALLTVTKNPVAKKPSGDPVDLAEKIIDAVKNAPGGANTSQVALATFGQLVYDEISNAFGITDEDTLNDLYDVLTPPESPAP